VDVVEGRRGEFTVVADGAELWSKEATGDFPEHAVILDRLRGS